MIPSATRGPKNPFNQPLYRFQKNRQKTPLEQRGGDNDKLKFQDFQIDIDNSQVNIIGNDMDEPPTFFSPQYSQNEQRLLFRNEMKDQKISNIIQIQQQQLLNNMKIQESIQISNQSSQQNTYNNIQSPLGQSRLVNQQFTCSNIIESEYMQQDVSQKLNGVLDKQKQLEQETNNYERLQIYRQLQQKKIQSPKQYSLFQNQMDIQQNKNNIQQSAYFKADSDQNQPAEDNLIVLDDSFEIEDEKGDKFYITSEKNKYPNESIHSKNKEYFNQEQARTENKMRDIEDDDILEQEFVSKNLDQKVKMMMDSERKKSFTAGQYHSLDNPNVDQRQNDILFDGEYSFQHGELDTYPTAELGLQFKSSSQKNNQQFGSINYKNTKSTHTLSPKALQQMSSFGVIGVNCNHSSNNNPNEGFNSFQHVQNSPSFCSTQYPASAFPLMRNHSTSSFKTILKKDKNIYERTDSTVTQINGDTSTKKSGKVKFNQIKNVVNYEEDAKEKTDFPYDDQMFQSDDMEDDSLSFPQISQNIAAQNKNYLSHTKITVLEKVNEKDREFNLNSSLINSNLVKESEIISSQSSNLMANKKKFHNLANSVMNNQFNSSSAVQEEILSGNQPHHNIQDIVQSNQDSIFLSYTNISPQITINQQPQPSLQIINKEQLNNKSIKTPIIIKNHDFHQKDKIIEERKTSNNLVHQIHNIPQKDKKEQEKQFFQNKKVIETMDTLKQNNPKLERIESSKPANNSKQQTQKIQSNKQFIHHKQSSESDLKTNSVSSNLDLIMAKISITQSNKNKQVKKKKKEKTSTSSCNIFQLIWH